MSGNGVSVFQSVRQFMHNRGRDLVLGRDLGYRCYLSRKFGARKPSGRPVANWHNLVLRSHAEIEQATEQVKSLGLIPHVSPSKDWDTLAALDCILSSVDRKGKILDAGGELYSTILPCLFLYGYKNLTGINLAFQKQLRRGPIQYERGDIRRTRFKEATFDAITCLSVIEHGVDIRSYFQEMSRILKPSGLLITSTDYYESPTDTRGQSAFGVPIHVFSRQEIAGLLESAKEFGLVLTGPLDLTCSGRILTWDEFSLSFTFLVFTLRKTSPGAREADR